MSYRSSWMTEELDVFRDQFRKYLAKDLAPHAEKWREQKMVDRFAWRGLGEMGALLASVPEEYGGLGATFAYDAAVLDDLESTVPELTTGVSVHSAIVAHYILNYGSEEQKKRWLPKMASGEMVGAIAMTEPGTGSDLQAVKTTAKKQGNSYVINGQKTFITNGQAADLVIVVARTGEAGRQGHFADRGRDRGRGRLQARAQPRQDRPARLRHVRTVLRQRHGAAGKPARQGGRPGLCAADAAIAAGAPALAVGAVASMERAVKLTAEYTKERKAFGKPLIDFQNTAFTLAERKTEAMIARVFVDWCIERLVAGDLDTVTASMAKYWCSDKQVETADECLQLLGGYGYMQEYPISRIFIDSRIQKIYGGTNEIMKLLIARSL